MIGPTLEAFAALDQAQAAAARIAKALAARERPHTTRGRGTARATIRTALAELKQAHGDAQTALGAALAGASSVAPPAMPREPRLARDEWTPLIYSDVLGSAGRAMAWLPDNWDGETLVLYWH